MLGCGECKLIFSHYKAISMKLDNLEKFVQEEREQFDTDVPSLKVWYGVDKELEAAKVQEQKGFRLWRSMRIAAAVALLLVTGGLIGRMTMSDGVTPQQAVAKTVDQIAPELGEMEAYYKSQVDEKIQVLASYEDAPMLLEDLAEIDEMMQELKDELLEAPQGSEEEIVNNIIRTYQTKIEILEHVLSRIQTDPNQNSDRNEVSI